MKTDLFDYELPPELVAFHPPKKRDGGRLLVLDPFDNKLEHEMFVSLPRLLKPGTLLVANDTKVIKARLRGRRPTGGAVEVLLVREMESEKSSCSWSALCKANKPIRLSQTIHLGELEAEVTDLDGHGSVILRFNVPSDTLLSYSKAFGEVPLPPYIKRSPEPEDVARYQTVYAKNDGSVAAPTAGLHFTPELIERLNENGVEMTHVTLHVGPGTFKPVQSVDIEDHDMDSEVFYIPEETVEKINSARQEGRKVVAVGTTVTRALEGVFAKWGELRAGAGETELFITPGFSFKVIDGLITNFHLPKSTLICLVSALAGREQILTAYREAVKKRYRFYSYGDAMLVLPG